LSQHQSARNLLKDDAGSVTRSLVQANALFKAARLSEAKEIAEQVLRIQPGNPSALEIKGNVQYLQGEVSAAVDAFIGLLELHPENQEAPYMLGRIYYQEGRIDQAIGQFQRVLRLNAYSFKACDNPGLCYEAKGDNNKAARYFLTAIKLVEKDHPEYDSAYANLAELLLKTGDAEKAFGAACKSCRTQSVFRSRFLSGREGPRATRKDRSMPALVATLRRIRPELSRA
jgi:tetratricopeptide (TPR) repeat protein